ncbi:helix-turn-helix domain-containing protein [Bacillus paramobilis]|uniref:helix-turn-helix domain-containing protein n=1 Tax=Bacillus paramobilis TaxID=2817477 RepID=UPI003D1DBF5B
MREFTYRLIDDKTVKRKLYILEALNNGGNIVSSKDLANQLDCSTRTIMNDVSQLKNELPNDWEIVSVKTRGYILIKPMEESIFPIIDSYLTQSVLYKIMLGIFQNRHYTLEKWSQLLYMRKLTLRSHLKDYDKLLNKNRLSIKFRTLQLEGDEMNVRYYYIAFFYFTQKFDNQCLVPIELRKKLSSILERNQVQMDVALLRIIIYVLINRLQSKQYITKEIKLRPIYSNDQLNCFDEIIIVIETSYNITLPKTERDALYCFLFLGSTVTSLQGKLVIEYLSRTNKVIYESYLHLVDILLTGKTVPSKLKGKLKVELISYFYKILVTNELHLSTSYIFDPVFPAGSILLENCKENMELVSKWDTIYNDKKFSREKRRLIATCATSILNSNIRDINILFLFNGIDVEKNIIYTKLKQNLGEHVKIHKIVSYDIKYDFIISNYQLMNTKAPVIYISGMLTQNEINSIMNRILSLN